MTENVTVTEPTSFSDYYLKNVSLPAEYVNQTSNRQARTYGPLMGLFLASLLTKAVAKYTVPSFLPSDYNPFYLLHNNKPVNYISYNNAQYGNSVWHPIENPYSYGPSVHPVPSASPENFPDQYAPPIQQPPTFTGYNYYPSNPPANGDDVYPNGYNQTIVTNIENPSDAYEPVYSASNINIRRQHPSNQKRRYNNFNQPLRYPPQNRIQYENDIRRNIWNRGYTTPFQNYDSYEDYSATIRNQPIRRIKPYKRKPIINYDDYYYNDSDYSDEYNEESFEVTTRSNKRKRRPTRPPTSKPKRKRNKNKKRKDSSEENIDSRYDESSSAEEPRTEIIIVKAKQRQASSTTEELTTFESTTTEGTTTTTESSNTTNSPGYETGYGPSNGNENISFTYGPPTLINRYQDYTPYINWYTQENARNSIVKRVQDIVGFDANVVRRG